MSARCNHVFRVPIGCICQHSGCTTDMGKQDAHGHTAHRIETEMEPNSFAVKLVCREHCPEHRTREPLPDRDTIESTTGTQVDLFGGLHPTP